MAKGAYGAGDARFQMNSSHIYTQMQLPKPDFYFLIYEERITNSTVSVNIYLINNKWLMFMF